MADNTGKRPPDAVYEMSIGFVEDLLLQRIPRRTIVSRAIEAGYCTSPDTVAKWITEVRRRWAMQDAEERPHRRDEHREMLRALYHESYKAADFRNCERVARQLMVLDGLQVPETINVNQTLAVQAMTPDQREAEIAALLKRREEALRGLPKVPRGVVH
jgi:hypothetical protein